MQRKGKNIYLWFGDELSPLEIPLLFLVKIWNLHYSQSNMTAGILSNLSDFVHLHLRATQGFIDLFFFHICRRKNCKYVSFLNALSRMAALSGSPSLHDSLGRHHLELHCFHSSAFLHKSFILNKLMNCRDPYRTVNQPFTDLWGPFTETWEHYRSCEKGSNQLQL